MMIRTVREITLHFCHFNLYFSLLKLMITWIKSKNTIHILNHQEKILPICRIKKRRRSKKKPKKKKKKNRNRNMSTL